MCWTLQQPRGAKRRTSRRVKVAVAQCRATTASRKSRVKRDSRLSFHQDPGLLAGFGLELLRLLFDRGEQRGPVRAERARSMALQAFAEGVGIDPGVSYRGDALLRRRVIGVEAVIQGPMVGEGKQRLSGTVSMVLGAARRPR